MIDNLKEKFKNFPVDFSLINNELIKIKLTHIDNSFIELFTQGAHLTKWVDSINDNHIFTSSKAIYKKNIPIRGGNPIIFPQFGKGSITSHGFARRSEWEIDSINSDTNNTSITLSLSSFNLEENFKKEWPYNFILKLNITFSDKTLTSSLLVKNLDEKVFSFTHGFHTYFQINDLENTDVYGLSNLVYMDQLKDNKLFTENSDTLKISEFTDRRYEKIPSTLTIKDSKKVILIETTNCKDAFLWNPHIKGEKNFKDLKANEFKNFICLEPGNMKDEITLKPKEEFVISQKIIIK